MTPSLEALAQEREVLFDGAIGAHDVMVSWVSGEVVLEVDGEVAPALRSWAEPSDAPVISFVAYVGELGPDADAGLLGRLSLDKFGELSLELQVEQHAATYTLPEAGAPLVVAAKCRCRKFPVSVAGCTNAKCDNTGSCPESTSHFCEWAGTEVLEFEAAFEVVVAG